EPSSSTTPTTEAPTTSSTSSPTTSSTSTTEEPTTTSSTSTTSTLEPTTTSTSSSSTSSDPSSSTSSTSTTSTSTTQPSCVPTGPEAGHCNDMIDNDCNGLIDCTDPACAPATCEGGLQDGQACETDPAIMACTQGEGVCLCPTIKKDPTTIRFGRP